MSKRKRESQERGAKSESLAPSPMSVRAPSGAAQAAIVGLLIAGALWVVYGHALDAPMFFDDSKGIVLNESITQLWPLVGDAEQPGPLNPERNLPSSGRPLVNLSLALNYHLGQFDPAGYRLFNLLLHLLSAMLLWAIVRRTLQLEYFAGRFDGSASLLAFAVALVWALHPLQTESVQYVIQRTELMIGFFYLATLYGSLRYWAAGSTSSRAAWLVVAVLACAGGMASKEVMVSAPLVVLLFERTFVAGTFRNAWRQSWPLYVGLAASWVLLAQLNYTFPRSDSAGFHLGVPVLDWWFNQATVLLMYLKLTVWPHPLLIHYQLAQLEPLSTAWPSVVAVAAIVAGVLLLVWRGHPAGFLGAAALAVLAPTHLVPITTEIAAERRMYLPLAALVALAVVGGYCVIQRIGRWRAADADQPAENRSALVPVMILAVVLAMAYGVVDAGRLATYEDVPQLWREAIAHQPHDHVAHHNLAVWIANHGQHSEAIEHYREALRLKPDFLESQYCLALTLLHAGKREEAVDNFRKAVQLKPDAPKLHNNLGVALQSLGRFDEAIAEFQKTIELEPDMADAYENLGVTLCQAGRLSEAIDAYEQALRLEPDGWEISWNLAQAYAEANRSGEAASAAQQAAELARSAGQAAAARQIEAWLARQHAAPSSPAGSRPPPEPKR